MCICPVTVAQAWYARRGIAQVNKPDRGFDEGVPLAVPEPLSEEHTQCLKFMEFQHIIIILISLIIYSR